MKHRGRIGTLMAALSLLLLPTATARTQESAERRSPSGCGPDLAQGALTAQVLASAVATAFEYQGMSRQPAWRVSPDHETQAILADPSSHLHLLGSYHLARSAVRTTCADRDSRVRAAWRSAAVSMSVGVAKEVSDGYYNGFSVTDLAVDAAGAGYAVAQGYFPVLEHINPAFSVAPRAIFRRRGPRGMLTDYSQQTFWVAANLHDLLPAAAAKAWPSPVRLSLGRRAFGGGTPSEYVVGLDLDAARLPGSHPAWMQAKRLLHTLRLPGPALVMTPRGTRAVGLYW